MAALITDCYPPGEHVLVLDAPQALALPGGSGQLVDLLSPDSRWQLEDGRCTVALGPLQARMLRLSRREE